MGHICFVILNYRVDQESICCAESILQTQTYENYDIVIVDNGSGNRSKERLEEYFSGRKNVHVIASEENLGFACGNNLGINYARENFDSDFIVVSNSDIVFEQPDYCEELVKIYKRRRYDILGGDIVDITQTLHFNPVARNRDYNISYMRKQAAVSSAKALMFRLIKFFHLKKAAAKHYGIAQNQNSGGQTSGAKSATREVNGVSVSADSRIEHEMQGVLLHGCCLVFSRDFFRHLHGFYDKTFLYAEEEILYYQAMELGMTVLYSPHIGCIHKEAVSTNSIQKEFCDSRIFYFSNVAKSYRIFLRLMKEAKN